jgi:hypothetical protein
MSVVHPQVFPGGKTWRKHGALPVSGVTRHTPRRPCLRTAAEGWPAGQKSMNPYRARWLDFVLATVCPIGDEWTVPRMNR